MIRFESEKDLQNFILENKEEIKNLSLLENISQEVELGNYGRVDILSWCSFYDKDFNENILKINLYELKNAKSNYKELGQLCRYHVGMEKYLEYNDYLGFDGVDINSFLVAPSFDRFGDFLLLYNQMKEKVKIVQFSLSALTGIKFDCHEKTYGITEHNFPETKVFTEKINLEINNG